MQPNLAIATPTAGLRGEAARGGAAGRAISLHTPMGGLEYSAAAKMTVLGLDAIKERLGKRWSRVSETVHAFFEASLSRRMRPCDVFYRAGELDYAIVFRDLPLDIAQRHCAAIAEEVCRRLFGEEDVAIAVRAVVGMAENSLLLEDIDPQAVIEQSLARNGIETVVGRGASIASIQHHASRKTSANVHELHLTFGPGKSRPHVIAPEQLSFIYRPIWDATRNAVLTYLCQPTPARTPLRGLCFAPYHVDDRITIDLATLKESARRIVQLHRGGTRLLVGCPVHFSTLALQRPWTTYARLFQAIPHDVARYLAFFVMGMEPGTPNTRLCEAIPKLGARSKFVFAVLDSKDRQIERFARTGVTAIGLELPRPDKSDRPLIEDIDALGRRASSCGIDCFILGAERTSTVVNAIATGVRFIEGAPISPMVPEPTHGFRHELTDLYRVTMV
jgi:hypothetical protein